jgi:hypothetical protein
MNSYKIGRDRNGNKVVKVVPAKGRGFSIQTNGNLHRTHRYGIGAWTNDEVKTYVAACGTAQEKRVMGIAPPDYIALAAYRTLHRAISNCVERGVISEETCPDDYRAIAHYLTACCNADPEV